MELGQSEESIERNVKLANDLDKLMGKLPLNDTDIGSLGATLSDIYFEMEIVDNFISYFSGADYHERDEVADLFVDLIVYLRHINWEIKHVQKALNNAIGGLQNIQKEEQPFSLKIQPQMTVDICTTGVIEERIRLLLGRRLRIKWAQFLVVIKLEWEQYKQLIEQLLKTQSNHHLRNILEEIKGSLLRQGNNILHALKPIDKIANLLHEKT